MAKMGVNDSSLQKSEIGWCRSIFIYGQPRTMTGKIGYAPGFSIKHSAICDCHGNHI